RMRAELGFEPRWTTVEALDDFVRGTGLTPVIRPEWVDRAEATALGLVGAGGGRR
ncbi:NAD-dependent dehydratase, partial [Mannheimia haemolytica]